LQKFATIGTIFSCEQGVLTLAISAQLVYAIYSVE